MSYPLPAINRPVPVFPLPNLVLFPHAVQFLHIFEPRYRTMVAAELDREPDDRFIAVALLQAGYEELYYTNHAQVYPMLCVSLVVQSECLDDGRYNLMIRGLCRARIRKENRQGQYRVATLEPLHEIEEDNSGMDLVRLRCAIRDAVNDPAFDVLPNVKFYRRLVDSDLPLGHVCDLLAFHLLPSNTTDAKQLMLEALDLRSRARLVLNEIGALRRTLQLIADRRQHWPPSSCAN